MHLLTPTDKLQLLGGTAQVSSFHLGETKSDQTTFVWEKINVKY